MEIIAFVNQKGGTGKSTLACNIAVEAGMNNKKVLLIDADTQGSGMAFRSLREKDDIKAIAITTPTLHKDIKSFKDFDFIIIDAGGRDSAVFRSAIMSCDLIIIPVLPSQFDIWGATDTIEILKEARAYKEIKAYFLLNQVISRTLVSKEAIKALEEFKDDVGILKSVLCLRVDYKNSVAEGKGVNEYKKDSKAGKEIHSLYKEIKGLLV